MKQEKTNFDRFLERKLQEPGFQHRFEEASRAWDIALQLTALRKARGLTQQQVADLLGTKQQAIARLENPAYRHQSLRMIELYVEALQGIIDLTIVPNERISDYESQECTKPLLAVSS